MKTINKALVCPDLLHWLPALLEHKRSLSGTTPRKRRGRLSRLLRAFECLTAYCLLAGCSDNQNAQQPTQVHQGVQSYYRNGQLEITAWFSFVPLDSQTLDRAVAELRAEKAFAWLAGGLRSDPFGKSSGERALSTILSSSNALAYFEAVLTNASPAGQLYALCGIHKLSPARFATLAGPLASTNLTVDTMFGCFFSRGDPVAGIVAEISAGRYDADSQPRAWRWMSNGSSNGVWELAPFMDAPDAKASPRFGRDHEDSNRTRELKF